MRCVLLAQAAGAPQCTLELLDPTATDEEIQSVLTEAEQVLM